ncbi:hypothetical protein [Brenneria goodwinii]|uniref:hypothetical protein n=1 Tax=Brenneria goodwinii TaxID=1109412 RepID=UPI0018CE762A
MTSAPNKENAKKFMEFFLQPEIAAMNTAQQMNGTPNRDAVALLPDALKKQSGSQSAGRDPPETTDIRRSGQRSAPVRQNLDTIPQRELIRSVTIAHRTGMARCA